MTKANDIASMFLVQALEQEKRRILRLLDALAEADAAEDDPTRVVGISAEYALDRIGTSCILGEVVGDLSPKQWHWIRDVANREHPNHIVSYQGREVGFWSYSWPTERRTTICFTLDPAVVQASMKLPADVLARASTRCLTDGEKRPVNRWTARQEKMKG